MTEPRQFLPGDVVVYSPHGRESVTGTLVSRGRPRTLWRMKVGESHRMAAERFMKHAPTGGFVDDVMSRRDAAVKAILRSWGHMSKETLLSVVTAYMDVADLERVADRARRDD